MSSAARKLIEDGYVLLPGLCSPEQIVEYLQLSQDLARTADAPLEYEAETGYPGAPESFDAPGGRTLRRLRGAYDRHAAFRFVASLPPVLAILRETLGTPLQLSRAHHNCVMFKHPRYGSDTGWHQDIRYWRFARPELISSWLALTDHGTESSCLYVVPGSHRRDFPAQSFDSEQFFRSDHAPNESVLAAATAVPMRAGDLLLFHCRLLHAAARPQAPDAGVRTSWIFTYHRADNLPVPGSRSAAQPDVTILDT